MAYKSVQITGPWKGACFNESMQSSQNDEVSINVNYAWGLKEPRVAFGQTYAATLIRNGRMGLYDHGDGRDKYIVMVGPNLATGEIYARFFDPDGIPTLGHFGAYINLTTLYGEPATQDFTCSFVNTTMGSYTGITRYVMLIVTGKSTYIFDPMSATGITRMSTALISAGGDAILEDQTSIPYLSTTPFGPLACKWNGCICYAGFKVGQAVTLDQPNPSNGTPTPLTQVLQDLGRQVQSVSPSMFYMSDPYDPAGVKGWHIYALENSETITHIRQFRQQLIIFTATSIYAMTGENDANYNLARVSAGVGCYAPRSVVEVDSVLYFMGGDGVYVWDGNGPPQKVSVPIDPLFTGRYNVTYESTYYPLKSQLGWPWIADRDDLDGSEGIYRPQERQIWWTLPVIPGTSVGPVFNVILVLNLPWPANPTTAWGFYCSSTGNTDPTQNSITGGLLELVNYNGHSTFSSTYDGRLLRYTPSDLADRGGTSIIPYAWMTPKIMPWNDARVQWKTVRLQTLPQFAVDKLAQAIAPWFVLRPDDYWNSTEKAVVFNSMPDAENENSRIWGYSTWGGTTWQHQDWFTGVNYMGGNTPSMRLGIVQLTNPNLSATLNGADQPADITYLQARIGIIRAFEVEFEVGEKITRSP